MNLKQLENVARGSVFCLHVTCHKMLMPQSNPQGHNEQRLMSRRWWWCGDDGFGFGG